MATDGFVDDPAEREALMRDSVPAALDDANPETCLHAQAIAEGFLATCLACGASWALPCARCGIDCLVVASCGCVTDCTGVGPCDAHAAKRELFA